MKHENTRLLRWEAENLTVLCYFIAYIGGLLIVTKSCFEAPHMSASPFHQSAKRFVLSGFELQAQLLFIQKQDGSMLTIVR